MILSYRQHGTTDWFVIEFTPTIITFTVTDPADNLIKINSIETNGLTIFRNVMQFPSVDFRLNVGGVLFYTTTLTNVVETIPTEFRFTGKLNDDSIFLYSIDFTIV